MNLSDWHDLVPVMVGCAVANFFGYRSGKKDGVKIGRAEHTKKIKAILDANKRPS